MAKKGFGPSSAAGVEAAVGTTVPGGARRILINSSEKFSLDILYGGIDLAKTVFAVYGATVCRTACSHRLISSATRSRAIRGSKRRSARHSALSASSPSKTPQLRPAK